MAIIENYALENHFEESAERGSAYGFQKNSHAKWAVAEILEQVLDRPYMEPADVVERFLMVMTCYRCRAAGTDAELIFKTASEVASDILEAFEEEGEICR